MMTRWLTLMLLTVACGLTSFGCSSDSRNRGAPPSSAAPTTTAGFVGQLTGDPDDEVDPQLQLLVEQALQNDETDEPLEGF